MPRSSQYPSKVPLVNWDPLPVMIRFGTPKYVYDGLDELHCRLLVDFDH
jgi:hypothetical protein